MWLQPPFNFNTYGGRGGILRRNRKGEAEACVEFREKKDPGSLLVYVIGLELSKIKNPPRIDRDYTVKFESSRRLSTAKELRKLNKPF